MDRRFSASGIEPMTDETVGQHANLIARTAHFRGLIEAAPCPHFGAMPGQGCAYFSDNCNCWKRDALATLNEFDEFAARSIAAAIDAEIDLLNARIEQLESTDPDWMADLLQEKVNEIGAEAEAFDKDCINAAARLAEELGLNEPGNDPWSAQDLYDRVVEDRRERIAEVDRLEAEIKRLRERLGP